MVELPKFEDLPYAIRKSPRRRWNYLAQLLALSSEAVHNISISVSDGESGVAGASVVIDGVTKTTGAAGGCTFKGLPEGNHTVVVSADGFTEKTESISVSSDSTSFSIVLDASK